MLSRLLSPAVKMNLAFQAIGITPSVEASLSRFLTDAFSPYPAAQTLFGKEPTLRSLLSKVGKLRGDKQLVERARSAILSEDFQDKFFTRFETLLAEHPDGAVAVDALSRISSLPLEGFGDTEHKGVVDFVRRGVFPLAVKLTEPEPETVLCHCGEEFPISAVELELGLVQCDSCKQLLQIKEIV